MQPFSYPCQVFNALEAPWKGARILLPCLVHGRVRPLFPLFMALDAIFGQDGLGFAAGMKKGIADTLHEPIEERPQFLSASFRRLDASGGFPVPEDRASPSSLTPLSTSECEISFERSDRWRASRNFRAFSKESDMRDRSLCRIGGTGSDAQTGGRAGISDYRVARILRTVLERGHPWS